MLLAFIKLPSFFKTFVLPIFEWLLKTGLTDLSLISKQIKSVLHILVHVLC